MMTSIKLWALSDQLKDVFQSGDGAETNQWLSTVSAIASVQLGRMAQWNATQTCGSDYDTSCKINFKIKLEFLKVFMIIHKIAATVLHM